MAPLLTDSIFAVYAPHQLAALSKYKYSAQDDSYFSYYVLNPFWTYTATFMPPWLAPNAITLIGFLFPLVSYALLWGTVPTMEEETPLWFGLLFGLGLWFYQTMDNVDGKQARATGTSSPLGELFDHGCDSVNVVMTAVVTAAVMRLGFGPGSFGILLMGVIPFYFSSWEELHTGTLYLGYINGPTEGIVVVCLVGIASALGLSPLWVQPAVDYLPAAAVGPWTTAGLADYRVNDAAVLAVTPTVLITALASVYSSLRYTKQGKGRALAQLVPCAVWVVSAFVWIQSVEMDVVAPDAAEPVQPWVVYTALTLVFGRMVGRIITSHLLKLNFPVYGSPALAIPVFAALNASTLHWVNNRGLAQGALVAAAFLYVHFVVHVISGFCSYLNIAVLTIPHSHP